ncbi:MAG: hypothetical protein LIR46_12775 [Bacteroidota bacterium]|nr:hypothetical protein [Bacteroidota bacterium]
MTLEEVNNKIKEKEQELEELKKIRQSIKDQVNLDAEKDRFITEFTDALDNCRSHFEYHDFSRIMDKLLNCHYISWINFYKTGNKNEYLIRQEIRHIWNPLVTKVVRNVTKNRVSGIKDRAGNLNVNSEELNEIKRILNEKIKEFCDRLWI